MSRRREVIRDQLRREVLPLAEPGQRLPGIREVSERYGGATGTIVDAYRDLAAEGLVEPRHGDGYYLARSATAEPTLPDVTATVQRGRELLVELATCLDQVETLHRREVAARGQPLSADDSADLPAQGVSSPRPDESMRRAPDVASAPVSPAGRIARSPGKGPRT